jgi:acetyltransferase-like isoleucine patch superfamily enzyme
MSGRDAILPIARHGYWKGLQWVRRMRRAWLIVRVKLNAALRHAHVDLAIAPDVILSRRVSVEIEPGTTNRLAIGSHTRVQEGVLFWLRGGTVDIGAECMIRRGVRINSSGVLTLGDEILLSYGIAVHCAEAISIDDMAIIGEYSTITDSVHRRTSDQPVLHHIRTSPTHIGRNVWVGASSIITRGVTIGDRAFVAAQAVVTKDVPEQWLAAGAPAKPVRALEIDEDPP